MRSIIIFLFPIFIFSSSFHYITKNVSNIHASFSKKSPYISQAIYGTSVEILSDKKKFVQIKMPDGYVGWIKKEDLSTRKTKYLDENKAKITALFAPIYKERSLHRHPPLAILSYGTYLQVNSFGKRWAEISLVNGQKGYILTSSIEKDPHVLSIKEMVNEAKRFVGLPYLHGGSSSYGMDCSGFVQFLFRQVGVNLPRNSYVQAKSDLLKTVDMANLQPGDLLFFNAKLKAQQEKGSINHVGIYLGDNEFIHSSTLNFDKNRAGVQISKLSDLWKGKLVSVKRIKKI